MTPTYCLSRCRAERGTNVAETARVGKTDKPWRAICGAIAGTTASTPLDTCDSVLCGRATDTEVVPVTSKSEVAAAAARCAGGDTLSVHADRRVVTANIAIGTTTCTIGVTAGAIAAGV